MQQKLTLVVELSKYRSFSPRNIVEVFLQSIQEREDSLITICRYILKWQSCYLKLFLTIFIQIPADLCVISSVAAASLRCEPWRSQAAEN